MIWVLIALFAAYVAATVWAARRAVTEQDPPAKRQAAVRFLIIASLGVPILVLLILLA